MIRVIAAELIEVLDDLREGGRIHPAHASIIAAEKILRATEGAALRIESEIDQHIIIEIHHAQSSDSRRRDI